MTSAKLFLEYSEMTMLVISVAMLFGMWRKQLLVTYKALALYLAAAVALQVIDIPILFFRKALGLDPSRAYNVMFFSTQVTAFIETALMIAIIYGVFTAAMSPFKGLQRMGKIVFRWVAGVSILLALVSALSPHVLFAGRGPTVAVTTAIQRVQESTNVLTLCLLLFVCFSIKSLGLSYRSRVFGLSLGLGIISTVELVVAAWFWTTGAHNLYSPIYSVNAWGYMAAFATWGVYLAVPEPAQQMLTLPTTSPFFHWNRIAEALGEQPGNVAISITPSMLAPAEVRAIETINKYKLKRMAEAEAAAAVQSEAAMEEIAAS
jgi:hypothetical protein